MTTEIIQVIVSAAIEVVSTASLILFVIYLYESTRGDE